MKDHIMFCDEILKYDPNDLIIYKESFESALRNKKVLNKSFDENIWIINGFNARNECHFKYETNPKLNNAIKAYVIIMLDLKDESVKGISTKLKYLEDVVDSTNGFQTEYTGDFECRLMEMSDNVAVRYALAIRQFLSFYDIPTSRLYTKSVENISLEHNVRTLSHYSSIIEFDKILNDYMVSATYEEKKKYYPIFIWWKLTKIIPMRPGDFVKNERNCAYEENGEYYIEPYRGKIKDRESQFIRRRIPLLRAVRIDKQMYDILMDYKTNYAEYDEGDRFFLSYKSFYNTSELNTGSMENNFKNKIEKDFFSTKTLYRLLKRFYSEVIIKLYGYKVIEKGKLQPNNYIESNIIENIDLGDTRHFAFCSMMLQGFNPFVIAQIGGHTSLYSQAHYQNHLETLIKGHVYALSKKILNERDRQEEIISKYFNLRELSLKQLVTKEKQQSKGIEPRDTDFGLCWNDWNEVNPYRNCNNINCYFCDFHTNDYNSGKNEFEVSLLNSHKEEVEHGLNKKIKLLKALLSNNTMYGNNNDLLQKEAELMTVSKSIQALIVKEAIVISNERKLKVIKSDGK
ncbi:hypothetical protein [Clostridium magnum]|uniref:Phage integrase family protein n=1 Tax=Clostridium magnum DSM 2767 TaxID=1121326 RepID=A0A162SPX0_9CLOT|nr:hypothetical protein [Clostridium magnum]KZL91714.1 hypothetical protein CLMAG_34730 [Clostridium magnum DSM 2767]SHJ39002.1 hypothetical protein SAMN02745944_05876 [Clostridium magnum DSM 2767]